MGLFVFYSDIIDQEGDLLFKCKPKSQILKEIIKHMMKNIVVFFKENKPADITNPLAKKEMKNISQTTVRDQPEI